MQQEMVGTVGKWVIYHRYHLPILQSLALGQRPPKSTMYVFKRAALSIINFSRRTDMVV